MTKLTPKCETIHVRRCFRGTPSGWSTKAPEAAWISLSLALYWGQGEVKNDKMGRGVQAHSFIESPFPPMAKHETMIVCQCVMVCLWKSQRES